MDKLSKDDEERLIDQLEESKQTELKPFFVDIRNIGLNNEKDGYVIRKEWNGQAVKKADLEKVEEIISKYKPKSSEIDNKGSIENNYKTIGYADVILEEKNEPDEKETETKDDKPTIDNGNKNTDEEKNTKSNKQKLKDAEEKIRQLKPNQDIFEKNKNDLINNGYTQKEASEIAQLEADILIDKEKINIIKENPKIKNGLRDLEKISKRIEKQENKIKYIIENKKGNVVLVSSNENEKSTKILNTFPPYAQILSNSIKEQLEKEEDEKIANISMENSLNRLSEIEKNTKLKLQNSLEAKTMSRINRAIDKWQNFGKEMKGKKGFAVRSFKTVANIALIGLASSASVEVLANAGVGSATALAGGTFSKWTTKLAIGVGIGESLNRLAKEEEGNKIKKIAKKAIPVVVGIGGIIAASTLSGGAVGLAAGASMSIQWIMRKILSDESLAKMEKKSTERKIRKIGEAVVDLDYRKIEKIEKQMGRMISRFERLKMYKNVISGFTKIAGATAIIEAVGISHDHNNESVEDIRTKTNIEHEKTLEKLKVYDEKHQEFLKYQKDYNETNQENVVESNNEELTKVNETNTQITGNNLMQENTTQIAIKLGMYNPGEENESMLVQSGKLYFVDTDNNQTEVEYSSQGAIQTIANLKEKLIEQYGSEENIPKGTITTDYIDMNGEIHNQTLLSENQNSETIINQYEGDKFNSDNSSNENTLTENPENNQMYEGIENQSNNQIDITNKENNDAQNNQDKQEINSSDKSIKDDNKENIQSSYHEKLTEEEVKLVHKVFNNNIDHLFSERPYSDWEFIQKNISAERILELSHKNQISESFKPLIDHMEKLKNLTGINPYAKDLSHPDGPETIPHFIGRALEEAQKRNLLEKVTL